MFPQSELDNYKLQVELLQEKLQRSEISRQHMEQKLDKILHKRDEHDKAVRSKAKQKYQQFLEEQQRRNERNKQLVQMLEQIEQQTEAMNARSERLKMMKLQYEMYFAKLVHSQTRRCMQSSVPVSVTPMVPSTTLTRPLGQTMMPASPSVTEEYNYDITNDITPQLMAASYQRYNAPEQFLRSHIGNVPSSNMEMPLLANFKTSERYDYMDLKNLNSNLLMQNQQQYELQPRHQANPTSRDFLATQSDNSFTNMERDPKLYTSTPTANENIPFLDKTSLTTKEKHYIELDKALPLSTNNTAFTIDRITNEIPMNIAQSSNTSSVSTKNNNVVDNKMKMFHETKTSNPNQEISANTIISQKEVSRDVNSSLLRVLPQIQKLKANKSNEIKPQELIKPMIEDYVAKTHVTSIEQLQPVEQMPQISTNTSKSAVSIPTTDKSEPIETTNLPYTAINNTLDSNSSTTPVSIENIENAIYGELLTPLETTLNEQQINSNLTPKLLENLVTQSDKIEPDDIGLNEPEGEEQEIIPDSTSIKYDQFSNSNDYEQQSQSENYDYNTQQIDTPVDNASNYPAYDNVNTTAVDENPQQQQYDYSNYDPSQYSYPGYIYDESTGEYKPDPNVSAEQYNTDQQYTVEGYDPQQYQQQEVYDYNQSYAQDPSSATADTTAYENYDTTQQENTTETAQLNDDDAQQLQPQPEAEPIELQPETETEAAAEPLKEELTQTTAKTTKPTSILSTADKNEVQKKKKRVNFVDSSETDESMADKGPAPVTKATIVGNTATSSESDFEFSSSTETGAQPT